MTKVQYARLVIQQMKKRQADELREEKVEGEQLRKTQMEKRQAYQSRNVEYVSQQRQLASAAVEGQKQQNLEGRQQFRGGLSIALQGATEERDKEAARVREAARQRLEYEHSPRLLEIRQGLLSARQQQSSALRSEIEGLHVQGETFRQAELQKKRQARDRIQKEIGAEAQQASVSVITAERAGVAEEVRAMKVEGAQRSKRETDAYREAKRSERAAVGDSKLRAKAAATQLAGKRQTEADALRKRSTDSKAKRVSDAAAAYGANRKVRDAVLDARRPES